MSRLRSTIWLGGLAGRAARGAARARGRRRAIATHAERARRDRAAARAATRRCAIDRAAEDAVFAELEAARRCRSPRVSEERGEVELGGGGPVRVVIDPIDGSLERQARPALLRASRSRWPTVRRMGDV